MQQIETIWLKSLETDASWHTNTDTRHNELIKTWVTQNSEPTNQLSTVQKKETQSTIITEGQQSNNNYYKETSNK